jgi:hypothetical protein
MPSITHEGPLDLVRQHPEIALELIPGTAGVALPAQVAVSLAPTGMSAVVPVQYLADIASTEVSDADRSRLMTIMLRLSSDAARQILEAMMTTSEYEKTLAERIHDQGMAEGEAKGEAKALLRLLAARGLAPSEAQRNQATSCTDAAQLDLWFDRAVTAGTAAEVFAD